MKKLERIKVKNANVLLIVIVFLLTILPQIVLEVINIFYGRDIGDLIKEVVKEKEIIKIVLLIINQYVFILLPVLGFIYFNKLDFKDVLRLNLFNLPNPSENLFSNSHVVLRSVLLKIRQILLFIGVILLIIIIAILAWFISIYLSVIVYHLYTILFGEPKDNLVEIIPRNKVIGLFLIALTPAICEETLFRGIMLRAYETKGTIRAIFFTGFMFALMHFSIVRFVGPLFIGILAGYLVVRSNSIIPAVITHFTFNGISLLIYYSVNKIPEQVERFPTLAEYVSMSIFVLFALIIMMICISVFNRITIPKEKVEFSPPAKPLGQDILSTLLHWPIFVFLLIFTIVVLRGLFT